MGATDWIAIIGAVTGIVGTVLGVVATYDLLSKNRVKLRVVPKVGWVNRRGAALTAEKPAAPEHDPTGGAPPNRLAVEVVNLSAFAVTISEVGFGRIEAPTRLVPVPELADGETWPVRLESREAMTAYFRLPIQPTERKALADRLAYAQTDCGVVKHGTSPMFSQFVDGLSSQEANGNA